MISQQHNIFRWGLMVVLIAAGLGWMDAPVRAGFLAEQSQRARRLAGYQDQYRKLSGQYIEKLKQIAEAAEQSGFAEDAQTIRDLAVPFDPAQIQTDSLPREVQPDLPANLPKAEAWRLKLRKLREDYAKDLYLLSRQMLHSDFPSAAYRLVREVAIANPDHKAARRLLGFQRLGDEWVTPFEAQQSRRHVWHEKFGWLPKTQVDRYERGERYYRGRWMSAEQEAEIRRDFDHAWEVRTEHFLVKTNHSLERGVEIAKKLEEYHDFFVQTFVGFFHEPEQLKKLFNSSRLSARRRQARPPFLVHYYRTREEYNQALVQKVPQIAITNGLYHNGDRVAYFYHDPEENNDSTLYHEATHQLLYETRFDNPRTAQGVGEEANFWVIEGIACYMESLKQKEGKQSLGDPAFVRFYWARKRYLDEDYYVPLKQFASMGMRPFQNHPQEELSRNYSQASGLVHFFMHYEGGIYRDAFIEHLSEIYSPTRRGRPVSTLAELTEVPFAELDQQYGDYLRSQQQTLKHRQPLQPAEN